MRLIVEVPMTTGNQLLRVAAGWSLKAKPWHAQYFLKKLLRGWEPGGPPPDTLKDINMALNVTKDCFPTSNTCHNCARKRSDEVKKETDPKEDSKRCANCHMMTYCDQDCQKEHWIRVHKKHCRFLSGKVLANGSKHNAATCARCLHQRETCPTQILSENSPETICGIEEVIIMMKIGLSRAFNFHGVGRKCNCSLEYAFELPFPLGEVSGQYLEVASTGLDAMLTHALKILAAMLVKKPRNEDILTDLGKNIMNERVQLWYDILVHGVPIGRSIEHLSDHVDSLRTVYGASNPWWKTLKFSVNFAVKTNHYLAGNFTDSRSLEDPRFKIYKQLHDFEQYQLQNQAIVTERKTWSKFMLWPRMVTGTLVVVFPPGTRCQTCFDELRGEAAVTPREINTPTVTLFSEVGDNGALVACCSVAKNPNCYKILFFKNPNLRVRLDENQLKAANKEKELFSIECRECDFCAKSSLSSHRCSACLSVQYCSTVCQNKDLDFHKSVCSSWAKDTSRKIHGKKRQKDYKKAALAALEEQ